MTSFNHYALGAVADWMHRTIGGLTPAEPGYRRIEIRPRPGGGLTHCRVTHITPYGVVECSWKIDNGKIHIDLVIPANTAASVTLPGKNKSQEVGSGSWQWSLPYQDPDARSPYTVDDLVDDIMADAAARDAMVDVLVRMAVPGFEQMIIYNEQNIPLRDGLLNLPNYQEAVQQMNDALASVSSSVFGINKRNNI